MSSRVVALSMCLAAGLVVAAQVDAAKRPSSYDTPPQNLSCQVSDGLVVCDWDDVSPLPEKYGVEVYASFDFECDDSLDQSAVFRLTTPDATSAITFDPSLMMVCVGADPCETFAAKSVQVRVKALNPPSRRTKGTQSNPFSSLTAPVDIPAVCAAEPGVTIIKQDLTDSGTSFSFNGYYYQPSFGLLEQFSLSDDGSGVGNTKHFDLAPGKYGFSEAGDPAWLIDIHCVSSDPNRMFPGLSYDPNNNGTGLAFDIADGEAITCTFENTPAPN